MKILITILVCLFNYYVSLGQDTIKFHEVNDSVSYLILDKSDGVCLKQLIKTYLNKIPVDSIDVKVNCDADYSLSFYDWKEYSIVSNSFFSITDFKETVKDTLYFEGAWMKKGYSFEDVETKVDTIKHMYEIGSKGLIKEIIK